MKKISLILVIMISIIYLSGCSQNKTSPPVENITISAAASLQNALNEIKPGFEQKYGIKLALNFGGSGTLQKQIEEGAPVDAFISAGKKQMDALQEKGLIDKERRFDLLKNKLVFIVSNDYKGKIKTISDLANLDVKIGIGYPDSVPAGEYSRESLEYLKLWDKLQGKIVYAKDVSQVTAYVERGETAGGIVYSSDALSLKNSFAAEVFDETTHKPIVYPAAIVSGSRNKQAAKDFLEYLKQDESRKIFEKYGFSLKP